MSATTQQLVALSSDGQFRARIRELVLQICAQIYGEDPATASHTARVGFAEKVLQSPGMADQLASILVTRTNLISSTITYDWANQAVVTDASDAAILSQLATDWNLLAGV